MNPLEQVVLGWECLGSAARLLARPALLRTWLPLALVRAAALAALVMCAHPLVSRVVAPLVAALAGPAALHYPGLFRVLPAVFRRVDTVIVVGLGLWTAGAASAQVAALAGGDTRPAAAPLGLASRRLPALWLAELPALACAWALTDGLLLWLAARGSGPLTVRLLTTGAAVALVFVRAFFAWIPALVVPGGEPATGAWRELGRLSGRGYAAAFTITLIAALPSLPLWFLLRSPGRWIDLGKPEWVAVLLAVEVAVTLLTAFLATLAVTLAWRALEEDPWLG